MKSEISTTFKTGTVCLAFLIIGYEASVFIHRAAVEKAALMRDRPDTVYVIDPALAERLLAIPEAAEPDMPPERGKTAGQGHQEGQEYVIKRNSVHSETVKSLRNTSRKVESFRFDPNTASVEDLQRLGFSEKQAVAIDNYRTKGGRFRRRQDFAKSFVVSDSIYRRLEKYIDIPLVDINRADSAGFDALPGIGGYFAARMVAYREALGGYSAPEQLMEIRNFDKERFDALKDLICCGAPEDSLDLWGLPVNGLRKHPYIRDYETARSIVFYREHNPKEKWTVAGLAEAGILDDERAGRLARCAIRKPR